MLGGKVAVVFGYGEVGKGCAQALRGQGCRVIVTEIDPICALQAAMEGYQVATLEDVVENGRHLHHRDRQPQHHHRRPHGADEGQGDRRQHRPLRQRDRHGRPEEVSPGIERINIKPQYDEWRFPDGHSVMVLAEGRLLNLGCATGPPELRDVGVVHQPGASRSSTCSTNAEHVRKKVFMLPKQLDEEVARLHLDHLGVKLTTLTKEQADYIGVPVEGPYKPDHYRY